MDLSQLSLKELAMVIGKAFKEHNIDSILVGGACVSIYSENKYLPLERYSGVGASYPCV